MSFQTSLSCSGAKLVDTFGLIKSAKGLPTQTLYDDYFSVDNHCQA